MGGLGEKNKFCVLESMARVWGVWEGFGAHGLPLKKAGGGEPWMGGAGRLGSNLSKTRAPSRRVRQISFWGISCGVRGCLVLPRSQSLLEGI